MANQTSSATITSASGETGFVQGRTGVIGLTGTMNAGAILVVVKPNESETEFVSDVIDTTAFQAIANEAGTGYSFLERYDAGVLARVALKANASFSGSVSAHIAADPY